MNNIIICLHTGTNTLPYIPNYSYIGIDTSNKDNNIFHYMVNENNKNNELGQIQRTTELGKRIYELAKQKNGPTDWLEIGSWNGLGTTLCIADGFVERMDENTKLISLEIDPKMYNIASKNLLNHKSFNKIEFVLNKLSSQRMNIKFPTPSELTKDELNSPHYIIHYESEKWLWENSSGYIPSFSPQVVVLDGGEYSGYNDWLHLDKSRLEWIFLDDTNVLKNKLVKSELLSDSKWECTYENDERNGVAIFKSINKSE